MSISTDPTIESAQPSDFLQVAALDRIAWPPTPDTFIPDGEHVWRVWCEYATVRVARLAEASLPETGNLAGALVMFSTSARPQQTVPPSNSASANPGELFLHKIMVHPDCRGQGLGKALMRDALAIATAPVLLTVDPHNDAAIQLYRSFGYSVRDEVKGYYRPHEDRYVMVYTPGSKPDE